MIKVSIGISTHLVIATIHFAEHLVRTSSYTRVEVGAHVLLQKLVDEIKTAAESL